MLSWVGRVIDRAVIRGRKDSLPSEWLIRHMREMGVEVRIVSDGEQQYMEAQQARGITRFWGASPQDTEVLLLADADNATVYEEYLHVLAGRERGWIGLGTREALEEVRVKTQVLAQARRLGRTAAAQSQLRRVIAEYSRYIAAYYNKDNRS